MPVLRVVPDASVAARWLLPEESAGEARLLLERAAAGTVRFSVPELWLAELGSVLRKRTRRGDLAAAAGFEMLDRLAALPVRVHGHRALAPPAYAVALEAGVTVYDAIYVVLAIRERGVFVTADDRLVRTLSGSSTGARVVPLREVESVLRH